MEGLAEATMPVAYMMWGFVGLVILVIAGQSAAILWKRKKLSGSFLEIEDPAELLKLTPNEFELMVANYYRMLGHKVKVMGEKGQPDHGIDLIVNTNGGEKWIVQCKRWNRYVGEPVIRDLYGTVLHEKADKGILVTSSYFSRPARRWVRNKPIQLLEGKEFLRDWKVARNSKNS